MTTLISHGLGGDASLDLLIKQAVDRIEASEEVEGFSKNDMKEWLQQLVDHHRGRQFFINKGWDGEFTRYMILANEDDADPPVIKFLKSEHELVQSTRDRYRLFSKHLNQNLTSDMNVASVPCGLMEDLLSLNLEGKTNVRFTGIDLDRNSLRLAKENASEKKLADRCDFVNCDAWEMEKMEDKFHMVTSNGLNIYEQNDEKVTCLYKQFHKILKSGGILITSAAVPPVAWNITDKMAMNKAIALTGTIVGVGWSNYRTEELTIKQLTEAGFVDITVEHELRRAFPTFIARKP